MTNTSKIIYSDIAELQFNDKESILYIKIIEDVVITLEKAKNHFIIINELTKNQDHFALVDATNFFSIDDDALKYMASPEKTFKKVATAYYSTNLANRLTMHFFKLFHKPQYPMQLFRYKSEAISWLEPYQKDVPVLVAVNH